MRLAIAVIISWVTVISLPAQVKKTVRKSPAAPAVAEGHLIKATLQPLKNAKIYLGCYYGKYKNLADSGWVNEKSEVVFAGKNKYPQGIYFIVSPQRSIWFEFLMDAPQHFTITADTTRLADVTITGSAENTLFTNYQKFLAQKAPRLNQLQQEAKTAKGADSVRVRTELLAANKELTDYRNKLMAEHPASMLAAFFRTVKEPDVPAMPKRADGTVDSLYPGRYVKEHYWDGVELNDARLLRTPFFDPKLERYLNYYIHPAPDSIIPEINYMLLYARSNPDMYHYLLGRFTDKYINPEIMGQDKVFLFLFNNYFSKGDTAWLNAKQREFIFNRAYSLMANQVGEPAPALELIDSTGKAKPLQAIQAPFTFVVFWDPTCGHCKEMLPRIDSVYAATWKAQGIKVYAVNVDEKHNAEWKKFVQRPGMQDWYHVYQREEDRKADADAGRPNFRQLYDIQTTPTLYLLDADKNIIAKKLSLEQFNEVIQARIKSKTK